MKISLYMWISLDGYIAKTDYNTDWISDKDFEIFEEKMQEFWCVISGNTTFKEVWVTPWITHIILSSQQLSSKSTNVYFCSSPQQAIIKCRELGFRKVLIIWWGKLNWSFLQENLIDEIIVDIQPVILWKWIKIFENIEKFVELDFISHTPLEEWLNILRYKVKK